LEVDEGGGRKELKKWGTAMAVTMEKARKKTYFTHCMLYEVRERFLERWDGTRWLHSRDTLDGA
jgi:hypothetical protein